MTINRWAGKLIPAAGTFQSRVKPWMMACFGWKIAGDKLERGDRLLEEVLETLQSGDYPEDRVDALKRYVYARPKGEMPQEVGGVMVTLAAFCLAHDIDMQAAGETELARIWTKVEQIRAKQAAKPTGSALPIATVQPAHYAAGFKAGQEVMRELAAKEASNPSRKGREWVNGSLWGNIAREQSAAILALPLAPLPGTQADV
jgi:hypothetical protein